MLLSNLRVTDRQTDRQERKIDRQVEELKDGQNISISLSLHLVLLAPVNSCELQNYYLVLSSLFMYSSSGLSTDVFFLIKRI